MQKNRSVGFTLIELLVVISIIGLLASVVLVALNNARSRSRDTKRVADMNQVSKALEMYYNENSHYPTSTGSVSGGVFSATIAPGLDKFIVTFPSAPTPAESGCLNTMAKGSNNYWYETNSSGSKYTITFCLGSTNPGGIGTGIHFMTPDGFK